MKTASVKDRKQQREREGRRAETLASIWMRLCGYRLVKKRYRTTRGEIDLIARRGKILVFIEVKYRENHTDALHAITPKQCQRFYAAASAFISREPHFAHCDMRFDLMTFAPWQWPRWYTNILQPDGAF